MVLMAGLLTREYRYGVCTFCWIYSRMRLVPRPIFWLMVVEISFRIDYGNGLLCKGMI